MKAGYFGECFESRLLDHCGFEAKFKCHALKNQALLDYCVKLFPSAVQMKFCVQFWALRFFRSQCICKK